MQSAVELHEVELGAGYTFGKTRQYLGTTSPEPVVYGEFIPGKERLNVGKIVAADRIPDNEYCVRHGDTSGTPLIVNIPNAGTPRP